MNYRELIPVVEGVATEVQRTYWKYTERDDVVQELWVWVVKHPSQIEEKLEEEWGEAWLHRSLKNAGLRYAQKVKADTLGYSTADLIYWNFREVEALLPDMFDHEKWLDPPVYTDDQGNKSANTKPPHEGGNWIATLADVSRAFEVLSGEQKDLLRRLYKDRATQRELADEYQVAQSTISEWKDRAVGKMHKALGGREPTGCKDDCECGGSNVTGSRRVISNAEALARTGSEYNGE